MSVVYVTSDQEGSGKTALCASLAQIIRRNGKKVAMIKLVTDQESQFDKDTEAYQKLFDESIEIKLLDLSRTEHTNSSVSVLSHEADTVLVEGPPGLPTTNAKAFVETFQAKTIVMFKYDRDAPISQYYNWLPAFGGHLLGVIINGLPRYLGTEADKNVRVPLEIHGISILGIIPEDRRLLASTVHSVMTHLDGRLISQAGDTEALVEHFMALGLSMDPGELYFQTRENKAVVVRGDRPDIQMSALRTPTSCIVATKGIEPIEYVRYEAEKEEVPLIVVEPDTLTTMNSLDDLIGKSRFDHPDKLNRYELLLERHVDCELLWRNLNLSS